MAFYREEEKDKFNDPAIMLISAGGSDESYETANGFLCVTEDCQCQSLFHKFLCTGTALLNGLPMIGSKVYSFAQGSSVQAPPSRRFITVT